MTIYRQEGSRGAKTNARCAKFPSLSRKRNSVKSLPPIYEIDEDSEENEFSDAKDKRNLDSGRLGKVYSNDKCFQENTNMPHDGEHWEVNKTRGKQQEKYREFPTEDKKETGSYLNRNLGRNLSVTSHAEGNTTNQMVFPDFFPPGMHVHCAKNALPEASKGLYMKIIQGEAEMTYEKNVCKTNVSTRNNSSYKHQNWMQFFG